MRALSSPEALVALFAVFSFIGVIIAVVKLPSAEHHPAVGVTLTVIFGAMTAFLAYALWERIDLVELALWTVFGFALVGGLVVIARRR